MAIAPNVLQGRCPCTSSAALGSSLLGRVLRAGAGSALLPLPCQSLLDSKGNAGSAPQGPDTVFTTGQTNLLEAAKAAGVKKVH